jgi:hypothetical protein
MLSGSRRTAKCGGNMLKMESSHLFPLCEHQGNSRYDRESKYPRMLIGDFI